MNLRLLRAAVSWVLLSSAGVALAGATRSFVLDSAAVLGEGKLEGTAVTADGALVRSVGTRRIDLPGVALARSVYVDAAGVAYVGTGNDGKIFVVKNGTATVFADTKELLVTSIVAGGAGTLFAATLPKGKVFAIDAAGKVKELVALPGAEHVWALAYDAAKKTLFAATGPEGKVFAIDATGKADVFYDGEAMHVMALARDADGTLYAGTSDQALLLRLRGPGRADVVFDFDGNEVTALDVRNGELAVAANHFPRAPASKPASPAPASDASSPQASVPAPAPPAPPAPGAPALPVPGAPLAQQPGKGQLYRVTKSGRAERLFAADAGHITTVEWGDDGAIYAGLGREGRVYRVTLDHDYSIWIDVDERQVLATKLTGGHPLLVTGDGAAIYEVQRGPAAVPTWTSKTLDAGAQARFGQLTFRGEGKLQIATRSGNTEKPDASWTDWSSPLTQAGPIRSPAARFLQVRVSLDASRDSRLYALEAFYLPDNRAAVVTDVTVEPPRPKTDRSSKPQSSSSYKIKWKSDNPDGDALRARIYYKEERAAQWRSLLREGEVVTGTEQTWETDGVPDGYYRIRVELSDELDNPSLYARKTHGDSEPLLVDNHPPHVDDLRATASAITGRARDSQGPIGRLEYTVNGLDWKLLFPADDLFDTGDEPFTLPLSLLPKGDHTVAVRASDARGNTGSAEVSVTVR